MPPSVEREATLVHLSDVHVFAANALRPRFVLDKRLIGGLNALLRRRKIHDFAVTRAALDAVARLRPDLLVVTGDITTLGAEPEFRRFREALEALPLPPERIVVIPGNHDAYVPSVVSNRLFERAFEPYFLPDEPFRAQPWPVVRVRGPLAVVGCSTARPCPPLLAIGTLGAQQLARLEATLADPRLAGKFRVLALHHPPQPDAAHWHNRLTDAEALRQVVARQGAELALHGHLHRRLQDQLVGPHGPVPVRGVASVSSRADTTLRRAQFQRYHVRDDQLVSEEIWAFDPRQSAFAQLG